MQSHSDRKGLSNIAYSYRILRALFSRARVLIMEFRNRNALDYVIVHAHPVYVYVSAFATSYHAWFHS